MRHFFLKNYFLFFSILSLILAFVIYKFISYEISRIIITVLFVLSIINSIINNIKKHSLISEKIQNIILSILWNSVGILYNILVVSIETPKFVLIGLFGALSLVFLALQIYFQEN